MAPIIWALWPGSPASSRTAEATSPTSTHRVVGSAERPVYIMILEIQLTPGYSPDPLHDALDRLKPSLGVDLTLRPLEQVRL